MTIQSISEIRRHAFQWADAGKDISYADDLEQDVKDWWLAAFNQRLSELNRMEQA